MSLPYKGGGNIREIVGRCRNVGLALTVFYGTGDS